MEGKKVLSLAVFTACVIGAALAGQSDWSQAARDHILDIHNEYRRNEGGCQINKLEYDMELETHAKSWAEGCDFKHEMVKGRGENLAYRTQTDPESDLITAAAQGWFDEKNLFTVGQRGCQRSCHYTQLVWDTTQKVGCYSTRCPQLASTSAENAWYFVCFYTPIGNTIGQEPYETSCDTPCRDGQTEEDGLCIGEEIVACVDDNEKCAAWSGRGQCESNPDYMKRFCKKSCKICKSDDETEEGSEEGGATEGGAEEGGAAEEGSETGEGVIEEPLECKDDSDECLGWAATDECTSSPSYMLVHCRASCKVCEGGVTIGECEDKNEKCAIWAGKGHCDLNAGYMLSNCRKACDAC